MGVSPKGTWPTVCGEHSLEGSDHDSVSTQLKTADNDIVKEFEVL